MRHTLISLSVLAWLAGCAGTQQASVAPVANPVVVAEPTPALSADAGNPPAAARVSSPEPVALVATEATRAPASAVPTQNLPQALDPLQCMMAWTKGMQDTLLPWTHSVQACDTRAAQR